MEGFPVKPRPPLGEAGVWALASEVFERLRTYCGGLEAALHAVTGRGVSCRSDLLGYLSHGDVWGEVKERGARALSMVVHYCPRLTPTLVEASCIVAASLLQAWIGGDGWLSLLAYKAVEQGLGGALQTLQAAMRAKGVESLYYYSGAVRLAVNNSGCSRSGYTGRAAVIALAADIVAYSTNGEVGVLAVDVGVPENIRDRERPLAWIEGYAGIPRQRDGHSIWIPNSEIRRRLARRESYALLLAPGVLPGDGRVESLVAMMSHLVEFTSLHGQPYRLDPWDRPRQPPCAMRRSCLRLVRLDELVVEPVEGPVTARHG